MSTYAIQRIAVSVPRKTEELKDLGILSEQKVAEYGSRIVRQINKFIIDEGLETYFDSQSQAVLPPKPTKGLIGKMKKLTVLWAQEEQHLGNNIFCKWFKLVIWRCLF